MSTFVVEYNLHEKYSERMIYMAKRPLARLCSVYLNACLLENISVVTVVGEPEHTLAADYGLRPVLNEIAELVLIER